MGWTMRHAGTPGEGHFIPLQGATVPFARTKKERLASGDHRASIEERYASLEDYLTRVRRAAEDLVGEGFLLAADVESLLEGAAARWDAFQKAPARA